MTKVDSEEGKTMVKRTHDEILDNGKISSEKPLSKETHTKFQFDIKESPLQLIYYTGVKARKSAKRFSLEGEKYAGPSWKLEKDDSGKPYFVGDFVNDTIDLSVVIRKVDNGLEITSNQDKDTNKYTITPNKHGGSHVEFDGSIYGAFNPLLLPMTYVPHTLKGKFVDPETGKDLTSYMDMNTFSKLRAEKNNQNNKGDELGYGHQINTLFNKEIPFLPKTLSGELTERGEAECQHFKIKKSVNGIKPCEVPEADKSMAMKIATIKSGYSK